jgi:MMPL family
VARSDGRWYRGRGSRRRCARAGYSVPGKEGWETNEAIAARYGDTGRDTAPLVPVVVLPEGKTVDAPGVRAELAAVDERLRGSLPGSRIASFASTGDRAFVSDDGRTIFALAYPRPDPGSQWGEAPKAAKAAGRALEGATVAGAPVRLTGIDPLMEDSGADSGGTSVFVEALISAFGAVLVLIFLFASFLALVPLLIAVVSIMTCFVPLLLLAKLTDVSPAVQYLIVLIGLGVAIDYLLLVVSRWREKRSHGASGEAAVVKAMETAAEGGRLQRHHGRDRPPRPGRPAGAVPALDRLRRAADSPRLGRGRDHPPSYRPREARAAARLAAPENGREGEPGLDALGRDRRAPPLARGRGRRGRARRADARSHRRSARDPRRRSRSPLPATPSRRSSRSRTRASARARRSRTRS